MTGLNRRGLIRAGRGALILLTAAIFTYGHDAITTKVTFDREVVRLMEEHCGSCHHAGGTASDLMTYEAARPWAKDIGEEVLRREMPPWGAVKGFGDFRNDKALTEEQIELIVDWEEGGAPEGDAKDIPAAFKFPADPVFKEPLGEVLISGDTRLANTVVLDGLLPKKLTDDADDQVLAELPNGTIEPLLWLHFNKPKYGDSVAFQKQFEHPFLLRTPLTLPAGTWIRGVPADTTIALLPAPNASTPDHLTGDSSRRCGYCQDTIDTASLPH